ncbi:hypothetical protein J1605_017861 [Eschrichtius robustus]|uniref:Uncharacterized protein n=1 Tax=Eschrichtius robustus TaxID=9764 RepID=A0AB34HWJ6_ESCRO|nr:hypothetical protein J1605_017861 [Eschrichtius robustus]
MLWDQIEVVLAQHLNVINATELSTFMVNELASKASWGSSLNPEDVSCLRLLTQYAPAEVGLRRSRRGLSSQVPKQQDVTLDTGVSTLHSGVPTSKPPAGLKPAPSPALRPPCKAVSMTDAVLCPVHVPVLPRLAYLLSGDAPKRFIHAGPFPRTQERKPYRGMWEGMTDHRVTSSSPAKSNSVRAPRTLSHLTVTRL